MLLTFKAPNVCSQAGILLLSQTMRKTEVNWSSAFKTSKLWNDLLLCIFKFIFKELFHWCVKNKRFILILSSHKTKSWQPFSVFQAVKVKTSNFTTDTGGKILYRTVQNSVLYIYFQLFILTAPIRFRLGYTGSSLVSKCGNSVNVNILCMYPQIHKITQIILKLFFGHKTRIFTPVPNKRRLFLWSSVL